MAQYRCINVDGGGDKCGLTLGKIYEAPLGPIWNYLTVTNDRGTHYTYKAARFELVNPPRSIAPDPVSFVDPGMA